jgi:hypothetical protein
MCRVLPPRRSPFPVENTARVPGFSSPVFSFSAPGPSAPVFFLLLLIETQPYAGAEDFVVPLSRCEQVP